MDKAQGADIGELGFDPGTFATALMTLEEFRSKDRVIWAGIDIGVASTGLCLVDVRNHEIVLMASTGIAMSAQARPPGNSLVPHGHEILLERK